jgi:hypothetical protein
MYGALAGAEGEAQSNDVEKLQVDEPSEVAKMFEKDSNQMDWEANGTILGLCIDVAASHGSTAVALIVMILGHHAALAKFGRPCEIGGPAGVGNVVESCVCTYTRAYFDCFPYVAWAVFILGAGKDFLQKRIYYGMLKMSGVIDFTNIYPYLDALILFLLTSYLHVIAHAGILFHFSLRKHTVEDQMNALLISLMGRSKPEVAEDKAVEAALVPHIAAVFGMLLPATLVLVFIYLHYDISKGLVTLSQFVHDVTAVKSVQDAEKTLAALRVISDKTMKDVLARDIDGIDGKHAEGLDFIATCEVVRVNCLEVSDARAAQEDKDDTSDLPFVNLLNSLWPVHVLLDMRMVGDKASLFRKFWFAFASVAICSILLTLGYIVFMIAEDIAEICGHDMYCDFQPEHLPLLLSAAVKSVHVIVEGFMVWTLAESVWWGIKDMKAVSAAADLVLKRKARVD